jgi:hypothetical protein
MQSLGVFCQGFRRDIKFKSRGLNAFIVDAWICIQGRQYLVPNLSG